MADTPAAPPPAASALKVPLSADALAAWKARTDAAVKAADAKREDWEPYVSSYMVRSTGKAQPGDHDVTVPLNFAYVELKKSQLRFQVPAVNLKPTRPEWAAAARVFEGALNHELGEAKADAMLDMVTTDVLICGVAAAKIGYYADIRTRQVPVPPPVDPMTGQPMAPPVDPLTGMPGPSPPPEMQPQDYVAHECYYIDRLAPENLLFPPEFSGGDYDSAAYIGHRFQLDLQTAITRYGLPKDFAPTATKPMQTLSSGEVKEGRESLTTKDVEGIELFYQATVFDTPPEPDPLAQEGDEPPAYEPPHIGQYRRLVLIKGHGEAVVHEDSPYQYLDEVDGKLKGMVGNPIHVLALRYLPGSPYPVSDVQAGFPSAEEVNLGRSQMVNFRERIMPMLGVDRTKASPELASKLTADANAKVGRLILTDGPPSEVIQTISVQQFPRDNFKFNEVAEDSFRLAWSMGKNQAGMTEDGEPITATEVQAAQGATDTRLAYEQTRFLKWWCLGANKFGAVIQQFKDEPSYAEIVGEDGVKALQAWNRTGGDGIASVQGEFVYTARPDAALRLDINADRQQKTQLYTQLGNDPNVNRVELLKPILSAYGLDPEKIVVQQLPEKGPEPPRISWSFKGDDLNPIDPKTGQLNAAFPIVMAIVELGGLKVPPEALQNAMQIAQAQQMAPPMLPQPTAGPGLDGVHPGATTPMQPISKHVADRTAAGAQNLVQ